MTPIFTALIGEQLFSSTAEPTARFVGKPENHLGEIEVWDRSVILSWNIVRLIYWQRLD
jgi:hypothetical protein